jgi:hypothetical protein
LLAPLRYLSIGQREKTKYDVVLPLAVSVVAWGIYMAIEPKPALFGDSGLLRFVRDLLVMAVPFMVGALAAVSMGAPGPQLDRRPVGVELYLDGARLTLRQFLCYLLGYLSFLGLVTLGLAVFSQLMRDPVVSWMAGDLLLLKLVHAAGALALSVLVSSLTITVFWGLYFLTDVANAPNE